MITAHGVSLRLAGNLILDRIDVRLSRGDLTALIGPNGAGKSTLFSILAGDIVPDEGRVLLADKPVASFSPRNSPGFEPCFRRITPCVSRTP